MTTKCAQLRDLVTAVGGGTPSRANSDYYGGTIPWVTPKDMKAWDITGAQVKITQAGLDNSASRLVPAGSVLVVVRSGVLKHTLPVAVARVPVAINQDMKALLCSDAVFPDFLARYIKARSATILRWVRATTADNFSIEKLRDLEVPMMPLPEQRRIAAVLDHAEALLAKRRTAIRKLDSLRTSVFLEMFGDPATNPKRIATACIGELGQIGTGSTPSRKNESYFGGDIPWVKTTEVCWNDIIDTEEKLTPLGLSSSRCKVYPAGSIVVALYGQGKTRGQAAILGIAAATNQACGVIQLHRKTNPHFLLQHLSLSYNELRSWSRGGNQENLNLGLLANFRVLHPELNLQLEFADRMKEIARLKASYLVQLRSIESLVTSLQHRAFSGVL